MSINCECLRPKFNPLISDLCLTCQLKKEKESCCTACGVYIDKIDPDDGLYCKACCDRLTEVVE
jgi:hypothetical protein